MGEYAEQAMREESVSLYGVDIHQEAVATTKKKTARDRRREKRKHLQKGGKR